MSIRAELPNHDDARAVLRGARVERAEAATELLLRLGQSVLRILGPIFRSLQRSRIRSELSGLTDAQLKDIGLTRADIGSIAAGTFQPSRPRGGRFVEAAPKPTQAFEKADDLRLAA